MRIGRRRSLALSIASLSTVLSLACDDPPVAPRSDTSLPASTPAAEGIDTAALRMLVDSAAAQHSDALVILRNGKVVYENYFGTKDEPIPLMSASKSIVSLAIGLLIDDGKLASIDVPVVQVLPDFARKDSRKAAITIRHLLTHGSGLDPTRTLTNDIEVWANESRCVWAPGASFQYNNNGVDILALVAQRLAGQNLALYVDEKLFAPLGIVSQPGTWRLDTRGVAYGAGDVSLRPIELARIGQMILNGGVWDGRRIISKAWLDQSFLPGPYRLDYGLAWWLPLNNQVFAVTPDLLLQWVGNGLPQAAADKLAPMVGQTYVSSAALASAVTALLSADEAAALATIQGSDRHVDRYRAVSGTVGRSYSASGWLGQWLDIVFDRNLVAVRMRRARPSDYANTNPLVEADGFPLFLSRVLKIVP